MTNYIDFIDSNGNEWTRTTRFREARETITAQAAVIEAIKRGMCNLDPVIQWLINGCDVSEAVRELQIYNHLKDKAIAIPTDSTQILAEVRKQERERCALAAASYDSTPWKHCEISTHAADMVSSSIARKIRAMED